MGCVIANAFSPMGMVDVVFGTACTTAALIGITKSKNLFTATLWPTICNAFIGVELYIVLGLPLFFSMVTVALGEFAVVTCIGYPLFRYILSNQKLVEQLKINQYCQIVLWVDSNWQKYPAKGISSPDMIKNVSFDYIVIATAEERLAKEIESYLVAGSDVEQERILYQTPLEGMNIMQTIV